MLRPSVVARRAEDLLAALDRATTVVPGGERIRRGHTNGPIRVALPDGFLDDIDACWSTT